MLFGFEKESNRMAFINAQAYRDPNSRCGFAADEQLIISEPSEDMYHHRQ